MRLLLTAFFFEAGLVLLLVPWSAYWEQNYFLQSLPAVQAFISNDFVRGGVSGLGLVNLLAGLGEIWSFLTSRHIPDQIVSLRRSTGPEE